MLRHPTVTRRHQHRGGSVRIRAGLVFAAVALGTTSARAQQPAADYSAEELTAAVTDRLTAIESLECEYEVSYGEGEPPARCRFARSGDNWHYTEISFDQERNAVKENTSSCDGSLVYAYVRRLLPGGVEEWGSVHLQDVRPQESLDPDSLLGLKLSNVNRSIVDVLALADISKTEVRLPEGTPAFQLTIRGVPTARPGPEVIKYDVSVTLDPVHDFLPRQMTITQAEGYQTWPGWANEWTITEYRLVRDEQSSTERWFPVSGVMGQGTTGEATIQLLVDKVRLNPRLPAALFRPEIPDGTTLADSTSSGGGRMAFKGHEFLQDTRMDELVTAAQETANPVRRWVVLVNAAVLAGLAALLLWRKWLRKAAHTRPE